MAISPQTVEFSSKIVNDAGLNFPVLSDPKNEYAQMCNIAFEVGDGMMNMFKTMSIDDITLEDAMEYIDSLIDAQLLVSPLALTLTAEDVTDTHQCQIPFRI